MCLKEKSCNALTIGMMYFPNPVRNWNENSLGVYFIKIKKNIVIKFYPSRSYIPWNEEKEEVETGLYMSSLLYCLSFNMEYCFPGNS